MTDKPHFTTDSTPGDQAFEHAVDAATGFIEEQFKQTGDSYGPRTTAILRTGVSVALADSGAASVENVRTALTALQSGEYDEPAVRMVCHHLDALNTSDRTSDEALDGGSHE